MKKDTYIYPAIFNFTDEGISIEFPDLSGCRTCGETIEEAMHMAEDALKGALAKMETTHGEIPEPTDIKSLETDDDQFIQLIRVFMPPTRKSYAEQPVRRNITIPRWMDECVRKDHLNVSAFVQEALRAKYQYND